MNVTIGGTAYTVTTEADILALLASLRALSALRLAS